MKHRFPLLKEHPDWVYLDSAATTQKPDVVLDALKDAYLNNYANVHRGAHQLSNRATHLFEKTRESLCSWLNVASASQVILTHGATESINMVAHGIEDRIEEDDLILVDGTAHHANLVPWQQVCLRRKAKLESIPLTESGAIDSKAYQKQLEKKPKLVALAHVSNVLGSCNDIKELTRMAHAHNALVLVDGAQAVAHFQVDVSSINCDFYVFSSHKMYGPSGVGVLTGRKSSLDLLKPMITGGEMVTTVTFQESHFHELPHRLEAGTPPIAEVMAFGATIDFLKCDDVIQAQHQEKALLLYAREQLQKLDNVIVYGTDDACVGVVSFNLSGQHYQDVSVLLDEQNIFIRSGAHCAQPLMQLLGIKGCCRISIGLYTEKSDIDAAIDAIKQARDILTDD